MSEKITYLCDLHKNSVADFNSFAKDCGSSEKYFKAVAFGYKKAGTGLVKRICERSGWKVKPHMLRPDIYINKTDGVPKTKRKAPDD